MLREDKNIELVRLPVTLPRMFTGRWSLMSGQKVYRDRWNDDQVERWKAEQPHHPVSVRREGRRSLWWFQNRFYWDGDGLSAADVKALALQRARRQDRKLKSAHALMNGDRSPGRAPVSTDLVRAVVARDGQRCVECGAIEDLQIDHILPVALGGATSEGNLQVLCADCNRAKSDSL
jgi:HNH endonuclease